MHVRCSKVSVKDIKRCKVTGSRSESSSVCHKILVAPNVLTDEGRTPPGSPTASFPCSHMSWRLDCTYSSVLVDLSKNIAGARRGVCEVGNRMPAGKCRYRNPIQQPLPASVRMCYKWCAKKVSLATTARGEYEYA